MESIEPFEPRLTLALLVSFFGVCAITSSFGASVALGATVRLRAAGGLAARLGALAVDADA